MSMHELSLKGRALRLLGMREHSRVELERKLKTHAPAPDQLAQALDELQAKGFINEQRVVESVINRRSANLGAARIRQELQSKGLDAGAVKDAVAALQGTELDRAREVWRRKFGAAVSVPLEAAGAVELGKQMRFLAARGFGADTIRRVVAGAPDCQDLDPDGPRG